MDGWDIYQTDEVAVWLRELQHSDPDTADLVDDAIYALSRSGPALAAPLVDHHQLDDREPEGAPARFPRTECSAILLVAGDKAGN